MGMSKSAVQAMVDAVPDSLVQDLRSDARKPNPVTQSVAQLTPDRGRVEIQRGSGFVDRRPDDPPHGLVKGNLWGKERGHE
jgi:hypothetical protein